MSDLNQWISPEEAAELRCELVKAHREIARLKNQIAELEAKVKAQHGVTDDVPKPAPTAAYLDYIESELYEKKQFEADVFSAGYMAGYRAQQGVTDEQCDAIARYFMQDVRKAASPEKVAKWRESIRAVFHHRSAQKQ